MSLHLLGKKIGMTQIFDKKGEVIPVTIIKGGPCFVTQIKSVENFGYNAIQIGYQELSLNAKGFSKAFLGQFQKQNKSAFHYLKEFRIEKPENFQIGQKFSLENCNVGEKVNISGITIGKGNGGNIKKHHFKRGPMGHGSKHKRLQGSLGSGTTPGRTFPGKRMPGRLGMEKRTIKNMEIIDLDIAKNLLAIKGSIPGKYGNLITIQRNEKN